MAVFGYIMAFFWFSASGSHTTQVHEQLLLLVLGTQFICLRPQERRRPFTDPLYLAQSSSASVAYHLLSLWLVLPQPGLPLSTCVVLLQTLAMHAPCRGGLCDVDLGLVSQAFRMKAQGAISPQPSSGRGSVTLSPHQFCYSAEG